MKKYDCFIFFNELDLLEIRLNTLYDYVDYFVIVESTKTFVGQEKPLYFEENKERFKQFGEKIIHLVVDKMPDSFDELSKRSIDSLENDIIKDCLSTPNVPPGQVHWLREFYQKEQIKRAIINCNDDDFIFISDLDEIWNPNVQIDFSTDDNYRFHQIVKPYYLNLRSSEDWYGTVATKYNNLKNFSINHLRTPSFTQYKIVENGGWHFTFQGGTEMVIKKIESYGHQEFNNEFIKNNVGERIKSGMDVFNRHFLYTIDNENLPEYLKNNLERYSHLIKK